MQEKQICSASLSPLSFFASCINSSIHGRVEFPRSRDGMSVVTRWSSCHVLKKITLEPPRDFQGSMIEY